MVNEKRRGFSVPALLFFFFLSFSPPYTVEKKRGANCISGIADRWMCWGEKWGVHERKGV